MARSARKALAGLISSSILAGFGCYGAIQSYGSEDPNDSTVPETAATPAEGETPAPPVPMTDEEMKKAVALVTQAPRGQWTYVPIPHAVCGNGSSTGLGINPGPASSNMLLIYYQGGGACSDAVSCFVAKTATYIDSGYNEQTFAREQGMLASFLLTHRTGANDPLANVHLVYLPYCTGDIHGGNNVVTYPGAPRPVYHQGGLKSQLSTAVLAESFANVARVVVSGSSAGGLGSVLNFGMTKTLFNKARVDLLSDSGVDSSASSSKPSWQLLPPLLCPGCDGKTFSTLLPTYARENPTSRFAAMSFSTDTVLPSFSGQSEAAFAAVIASYFQQIDTVANARTFTAPGSGHVVLNSPALVAGNVSVKAFVEAMLKDDPAWHTVP